MTWSNNGATVSGPSSCTYGRTFSVPADPAPRTGYVFTGWKANVRPPETCGIERVDPRRPLLSCGGIYLDGTEWWPQEFAVTTPGHYGCVGEIDMCIWGRANCNSTRGEYATQGRPQEESKGVYCWTKLTAAKADDRFGCEDGPDCIVSPESSTWVFMYEFDSEEECAEYCVNYVVGHIMYDDDHSAVFDAVTR